MLVPTRGDGESILISESIEVTILRVDGGQVRVGVRAPLEVSILCDELISNVSQSPQCNPPPSRESSR
jgi:carbon storage regulator